MWPSWRVPWLKPTCNHKHDDAKKVVNVQETLSTTALAGSRRKLPKIRVGGRRQKRRAAQDDLDALSTMATMEGPVFPRKRMSGKRARRILKSNGRKIPLPTVRKMIKASKGGIWLDSRATLTVSSQISRGLKYHLCNC